MNSRKTRKDANLPREGNPTPHPHPPSCVRSGHLAWWAPQSCFPLWTSPPSPAPLPQTPKGSRPPAVPPRPPPSPSSRRKPALPWRGAGSVENSLLPPLLLPDFQSSPVLLPKAVPLEEPPPELLTGHASARAGDLGLDRGLPPGLAASDLGEGGDRLGPGRSLPRGGAFTHMVRAWTPAQASRPNLTTGSVILL